MTWDDLIGKLHAALLESEHSLTPDDVENIWELIDVGEPGVAFELLCSQLYEYDAAVSPRMLDSLREMGTSMQLKPRQWEILRVADHDADAGQ
ncbi:MAG TPA: MafI family immunity protein [Kribbella sp.]|nr:MafI family immunity protein [Kribbella sp.]